MILVYPILLVAAAALAWQQRGADGGRGAVWAFAWSVAGFLFSFSLATGLSIGLLVLPAAALGLLWTAHRSPHVREATGFAAGVAVTAALITALNV